MKILIAYDGSSCADSALEDLRRAGLPRQSEAIVLSVAKLWSPAMESARAEEETFVEALPILLEKIESLAQRACERVQSYFPDWTVKAEARSGSPWRHSRRYGSRRVTAEVQDELKAEGNGEWIGRRRVQRLMRELELAAIQPRRFVPRTTDSRHGQQMSPNLLLEREIQVDRLRQVIVSDITYLPLQNGKWAYLATWMDLFSRKIIGWAVAASMTAELVIDALKNAILREGLPAGLIVHSDPHLLHVYITSKEPPNHLRGAQFEFMSACLKHLVLSPDGSKYAAVVRIFGLERGA